MFAFLKRLRAPVVVAAPPVPSTNGMTGQPFAVSVGTPTNLELDYHKSRIPQLEQSIADLKAAGKDTTGHEQALKVHNFIVEMSRG